MNLPVRLVDGAPDEPAILVDGFARADGLVLSHWPGNTTPPELKHELSTGIALAFARLPADERARLAGDARAIVNNHHDTDGVLALFAVRFPDVALAHEQELLDAAAAGDFYAAPTDRALALDSYLTRLVDPERSPLDLAGLDERQRGQLALDHLLRALPGLLDGGLAAHRALWEDRVEAVRADAARLAASQRRDVAAADLTVWTVPTTSDAPVFEPMRHALCGASDADRTCALGTSTEGTSCRLVVSTRSWFDLPGRAWRPRPDLDGIARRLNELGGTEPRDGDAWRASKRTGASPELWFGGPSDASFADRLDVLAPSPLAPDQIQRELTTGLTDR